ncbi:uncharacterized protein LOC110444686 isoform X1 [Mizuhopecten yessoensis]|nr:uncharacterized protein LOC110444686 isoform X1 [Mizuhopecten yessoensis]
MTSDHMVSEAGLGPEAFLPNGNVFIPSAKSSDVNSNPCARRRGRQPSFTSRSIEENSVQSYLATASGNIVYGLSPMPDQSTKADFHPDNNTISDQTQFSHGDPVPGYFDTDASCHQRSNLCHHIGNGINEHSMVSMNSEPTENLAQTSSTQASYEARMDHFVHEAGQFSTESESERDVGFSGHSTSSSCQLETSPTDQEQVGSAWNNFPIDWSDAEADICLHGNNKIDDLIYHFDKFFRGQIDNKLSEMGDFIHSLMTEQQTHVRYIVNTAVTNSQTWVSVEKDTTLGSPVRKMTRLSSGETGPDSLAVTSPITDHVDLSDDAMTPQFLDKSAQV